MTLLPALVSKGGFELMMIRRVGRAAIYRQHLPGGNPDHDGYEVILPQVRNTNHNGEPVEPYEGYPAAESWGKKGWTFNTLAKAVEKLKHLANGSDLGTGRRRNHFEESRSYPLIANRQRIVPVTRRFGSAAKRKPFFFRTLRAHAQLDP